MEQHRSATLVCLVCHHHVCSSARSCGMCGVKLPVPSSGAAAVSPPAHLWTRGKLLGPAQRYRVERLLGRGGFGAAYLMYDLELNRPCVAKRLVLAADLSPAHQKRLRSNFQRETQLLVSLNHPGHPNIPEIYEYLANDHCLVIGYELSF